MYHSISGGQFFVFEFLIRRSILSKELYDQELKFKLGNRFNRSQMIRTLNQFAREGRNYEFETEAGVWTVRPVGKTDTGYNLWDLWLRPVLKATA